MPMRAEPALCITALTSAKSTLIIPGIVIRSEIPSTACRKTSSHIAKAERNGVSFVTTERSLSFGMTIKASTASRSLMSPPSAMRARSMPSKANGFVTTPIASAPCALAACATTGAPPVPVPPPIPQVINTISAPFRTSWISSLVSSAACRPKSGFMPVPNPLVTPLPILIFLCAKL